MQTTASVGRVRVGRDRGEFQPDRDDGHRGRRDTRGGEYAATVASGILEFDWTLRVVFINGYAPRDGDTFDLFDGQIRQGAFQTLDCADVGGSGLLWDASNLYTTGAIALAAVPEPATVLGLAAAGLGLMGVVRHRRSNRGKLSAIRRGDVRP